ncbi:MAG: SGNH hydrolase domain-containing protein [Cellulomonadaceae bacterium]
MTDGTGLEVLTCDFGDLDGGMKVALVGGSHSGNFLPAIDRLAQERGVLVRTFLKSWCPVQVIDDDGSCAVWSRVVIDQVIDDGFDAVVLSGTRPIANADGDHVPDPYLHAWKEFLDAGVAVVAIRDVPWLGFDGPECVLTQDPGSCSVSRSQALSPLSPLDLLAERFDDLHAIDLSDLFCDVARCYTVVGNVLAYNDDNHITATFSETLAVPLDALWSDATGWW